MPLASHASDLLWTERNGGFTNVPNLPRQVSDYAPLVQATYASTSGAQMPLSPISPRNDVASSGNASLTQATRNSKVLPVASADRAESGHSAERTRQIAAYATAPAALFAYGNQMQDGLHQRLGEIRNILPVDDFGGELFVRYSGVKFNISSDATLSRPGYDFKHQANVVQLGGSVIGWNDEGSNVRAGWAYDQGVARVKSEKSGVGSTNHDIKGISLWVTAQRNGMYVDVVAGRRRFDGHTQDDASGNSAKVHANSWVASLEAGLPTPLNDSLTIEPQAQLTYQSLRINPIKNTNGIIARSDVTQQVTARVGVRFAKTDNERFVPYAKVDFSKHFGGQPKVTSHDAVSRGSQTLDGIGPGPDIGFSAGMTINVTRMINFYGDAGVQRRLGDRGVNGLVASAGVRINF